MSTVLDALPLVQNRSGLSASELLTMPDRDRFELVNGKLVERNKGWESEYIGFKLRNLLFAHCEQNGLGYVSGSNASYQCFEESFPDDPERVRKPDVSFIAIDRMPEELPEGHCELVPDLAVEVISPNDRYREVEAKIGDYLSAGVRLVWVVDPDRKLVRIHRADGTVEDLQGDDLLTGEEVIPQFQCRVSDIFSRPMKRPSA